VKAGKKLKRCSAACEAATKELAEAADEVKEAIKALGTLSQINVNVNVIVNVNADLESLKQKAADARNEAIKKKQEKLAADKQLKHANDELEAKKKAKEKAKEKVTSATYHVEEIKGVLKVSKQIAAEATANQEAGAKIMARLLITRLRTKAASTSARQARKHFAQAKAKLAQAEAKLEKKKKEKKEKEEAAAQKLRQYDKLSGENSTALVLSEAERRLVPTLPPLSDDDRIDIYIPQSNDDRIDLYFPRTDQELAAIDD